jgi:ribose transport system substrate-binding protein
VHCSELLSAFELPGECLTLREIARRSKLPKSMAFRLLYTLEECSMVEKVGRNLYRSDVQHIKRKTYKLGYAAQGTDYLFSKEVSENVQRAGSSQRHCA